MINKKTIIILSSVLILVVGVFLAMLLLWKAPGELTPQDNAPSVSSITLFTAPKENVVRMDVKLKDDSFNFTRDDEEWVLSGNKDIKLKKNVVDNLAIELTGVYAQECIEEKPSDLSKYGLSEPLGTYKVSFLDGTSKIFHLGNKEVISGSYYFKVDDQPSVYMVYSSKGDTLLRKADEYRNTGILEFDTENVVGIYMKNGATELKLAAKIEGEGEEAKLSWTMTKPIQHACDSEMIYNNIISKISYMSLQEFVDEDDERYYQSGVANPTATIEIRDANGITQTIYVGVSNGDMKYIKTNGKVYLINGDSLSFLNVDPFIYLTKFINIQNIDDVSKIEIVRGDKKHVVTIEGKKNNYVYKLNGKEVLENTFKRQIYQKIIGLLADDFARAPKYKNPDYTVVFYLRNGTVLKNDYCYYDERSYAVFDGNGNCKFIIRQKELSNMFASLDNVASGRAEQ